MPRPAPRPKRQTTPPATQPEVPEVVDPRWLLKAIGAVIAAALVCAYLTLCLLFYQGQWQLVLHPSRVAIAQPPVPGAELVHFGLDESATPQLTGWWIPSAPGGRYAGTTLLYLRGGDGSLAASSAALSELHQLGINVFAFDYRGYGASAALHPNQQRMNVDANFAWQYLRTTRSIPEQRIVPFGVGVGASLAAALAAEHPGIPALIVESPQADLLGTIARDPRSELLPVRLLFHERFPLAAPLASLRTPKLLLSAPVAGAVPVAFRTASDPKMTVELAATSGSLYQQALVRFLDQYIAANRAPLLMTPPATPGKMAP